jgi:exopolysaccharide biosynthesis polyprenyl glycosylphosphotransferase
MNSSNLLAILWSGMALLALLVTGGILESGRRLRSRNLGVSPKNRFSLLKGNDGPLTEATVGSGEIPRARSTKTRRDARPDFKASHYSRETLESILLMVAIIGDFAMILLGFAVADILLFRSDWIPNYLDSQPMPTLINSYRQVIFGSMFVLWGLTGRDLYTYKNLLFPSQILGQLIRALCFCLFAFVGISLVISTDPPIPRTFFVCAVILIFLSIYNCRRLLSQVIQYPALAVRLRRRLVVIGGGSQTLHIKRGLGEDSDMEFVGWVQAIKPNQIAELEEYRLGSLHELGGILQRNGINIAVLTESESLQREGVLAVAKACEKEHVQFKMVPHFFEILISGLRPDVIGGIQLLGVDELPFDSYKNRVLKRTVDIIGALVGLTLSIPLIIVFGALVYRESPGPILYKQIRQGRKGRLFHITKIRSMRVNAEAGSKAQWAQPNDQRRLRIGAFLRKWNIDEVPQFWNVLVGEMSLVGPRPERPELIARFKSTIPHYQARHMCRPGMTGWAQVNGWRGNTDLQERIHHDIWYLEKWTIWLDFRIMFLTFIRRENAY